MHRLATASLLLIVAPLRAEGPWPVPLTRPEMKRQLEAVKDRTPRIPLPELTAADREKLGDRADSYEARLRYHYLGEPPGRTGRDPDPAMTLDYRFKTQLFWIVSRANNCPYCLGHQESKLLAAGMTDDEIAALDGDWAGATPAARAAYAFARKFTLAPQTLADADVAALRPHYTDAQVVEMILSMAGNNAINRWKEGVGVPQSATGGGFGRRGAAPPAGPHTYLTPTSEKYASAVTKVAPVKAERPPPGPAAEGLAAARARTPRLALADEAAARAVLPAGAPPGPVPQWVRLLAHFPVQGKARVAAQIDAEAKGDLSPLLKARVAWVVARRDGAWYAADRARRRLLGLGQTEAQVDQLDGDGSGSGPAERAMLAVARKLAASPVALTDADVAAAVRLAGPRDVVQLVSYVTVCASFDRITEAAGLRAGE